MLDDLKNELGAYASEEKAKFFPRFFKAGPGGYAEGDKFIGVTVPNCRVVAKKYANLPLPDIQKLIYSKVHEERLVALLILVEKFKKADDKEQEKVYNFYLKNTKYINNWDLVDLSADKIVGEYLFENPDCATTFQGQSFKGITVLSEIAKSKNLWERRISIISTFAFIRRGELNDTIKIATILLKDKHDLIHKAVGWMLREVGKRSEKNLTDFLKENYSHVSRTTLRYAIERFPKKVRKDYLLGQL